jgi:hypothetical protein
VIPIIAHLDGQDSLYQMRDVRLVRPDDRPILHHEELPWLTLITYPGYHEASDTTSGGSSSAPCKCP